MYVLCITLQEGSKCVLYTFRYLSNDQDKLTSLDDVQRNDYSRFNSFYNHFLSNPSSNPNNLDTCPTHPKKNKVKPSPCKKKKAQIHAGPSWQAHSQPSPTKHSPPLTALCKVSQCLTK